jgi:hypothetical protein
MPREPLAPPDAAGLSALLGGTAKLWDRLVEEMATREPPVTGVWHFAGSTGEWSMRLKQGDRIILYVTPQPGRFVVGVVLGEKAVDAARRAKTAAGVLALIEAAPRCAVGRGIRLPVKSARDLRVVRTLAALKLG